VHLSYPRHLGNAFDTHNSNIYLLITESLISETSTEPIEVKSYISKQTLARKLFQADDWPKVHGTQEPEKCRKIFSQLPHLSKNMMKSPTSSLK
jgi:hypothetical protein